MSVQTKGNLMIAPLEYQGDKVALVCHLNDSGNDQNAISSEAVKNITLIYEISLKSIKVIPTKDETRIVRIIHGAKKDDGEIVVVELNTQFLEDRKWIIPSQPQKM